MTQSKEEYVPKYMLVPFELENYGGKVLYMCVNVLHEIVKGMKS